MDIVLALCVLTVTIGPHSLSAQDNTGKVQEIAASLSGVWKHFDMQYEFNGDVLKIRQLQDGLPYERTYLYNPIVTEDHNFLRCVCRDTAETILLLSTDVTDSTAVMTLGSAFVRADSGNGLPGSWEHAEGLSIMRAVFTDMTLEFSESRLDLDTGEMVIEEFRTGTFSFVKGRRGRIRVAFGSGETVDMVPLVAGKIMYLFDLSPRKSLFVRKKAAIDQVLVLDNHLAPNGKVR